MPRDAIMLGVRLEFTMAEFFAVGGVTTFVDRMAASLGIHAADIRVVSVYEGSTIVDFEIITNLLAEVPVDLEAVKETFSEVVAVMDEFMGSSLLGAISIGVPIVTLNTPQAEGDGGTFDNIFCLDGCDEEEEREPNIQVEVRYRESVTGNQP